MPERTRDVSRRDSITQHLRLYHHHVLVYNVHAAKHSAMKEMATAVALSARTRAARASVRLAHLRPRNRVH